LPTPTDELPAMAGSRKQGIGSSDAATACGLNPYMSMLELWMIKTGRMQH
jgi:predicted phage-related endonuclease